MDRVKASEVALFANVRPLCSFMPTGEANIDIARKMEWYFDWRLRYSVPDFFQQLILGIDDRLQMGKCFFKVIYEYETETVYQTITLKSLPGRLKKFSVVPVGGEAAAEYIAQISGGQSTPITKQEFDKYWEKPLPQSIQSIKAIIKDEFDLDEDEPMDRRALEQLHKFFRSGEHETIIKKREVMRHYPRMISIDPLDVIVPSWTKSLESAERITHRMWLTKDQLLRKVRDQKWNESVVDQLITQGGQNVGAQGLGQYTMYNVQKAVREGVFNYYDDPLFEVHESYCLYDLDGDGVGEKAVIWTATGIETPLKFIAYPYDHNQWPIIDIPHELNDKDFYSPRGIPEKIKDLDEEITQQHRAKLNRMLIANSPTFTYRRGSGFNPSKVRWIPGEMYQVGQQGDVAAIQIPNLDISFDREQNILRAEIESYVGVPDTSITSPLSKPSQPRTATEISVISNVSQQASGYRTLLFQLGMQKVLNQMWALEEQYGPEELWVRVAEEPPQKVTRKEIQGKFVIVPRGTVVNSTPEAEAQKALTTFQILAQAIPFIQQDPRYDVDIGQGILDYERIIDPLNSRRIIRKRSPQEVQQIVAQQQKQMEQQQALQSNQPMRLEDMVNTMNRMKKEAPNGAAQNVDM